MTSFFKMSNKATDEQLTKIKGLYTPESFYEAGRCLYGEHNYPNIENLTPAEADVFINYNKLVGNAPDVKHPIHLNGPQKESLTAVKDTPKSRLTDLQEEIIKSYCQHDDIFSKSQYKSRCKHCFGVYISIEKLTKKKATILIDHIRTHDSLFTFSYENLFEDITPPTKSSYVSTTLSKGTIVADSSHKHKEVDPIKLSSNFEKECFLGSINEIGKSKTLDSINKTGESKTKKYPDYKGKLPSKSGYNSIWDEPHLTINMPEENSGFSIDFCPETVHEEVPEAAREGVPEEAPVEALTCDKKAVEMKFENWLKTRKMESEKSEEIITRVSKNLDTPLNQT